jgi:hypothetical protein
MLLLGLNCDMKTFTKVGEPYNQYDINGNVVTATTAEFTESHRFYGSTRAGGARFPGFKPTKHR